MSIVVKNICKKYNDQLVLNDISFTVKRGEIVGFIGPNGAGKTTTMKIICGLIAQDSGEVLVNDLNNQENLLAIKKLIGYLPENNPLYYDLYIKEYLEFVSGFYKKINTSARINDIIEVTGLRPEINKKIGQLSKGYRQRVGLAQCLIHDPDILILDEPTTGLDPNQIIEIRNLISSFGKNKTIILSTHILQEVEAICDKVVVISKGAIIADDNPANLKKIYDKHHTIIVEFNKKVNKSMLEKIEGIEKVKQTESNIWLIQSNQNIDLRASIFNFAVNNNLTVLSMQKKTKQLEEVFKEITNE